MAMRLTNSLTRLSMLSLLATVSLCDRGPQEHSASGIAPENTHGQHDTSGVSTALLMPNELVPILSKAQRSGSSLILIPKHFRSSSNQQPPLNGVGRLRAVRKDDVVAAATSSVTKLTSTQQRSNLSSLISSSLGSGDDGYTLLATLARLPRDVNDFYVIRRFTPTDAGETGNVVGNAQQVAPAVATNFDSFGVASPPELSIISWPSAITSTEITIAQTTSKHSETTKTLPLITTTTALTTASRPTTTTTATTPATTSTPTTSVTERTTTTTATTPAATTTLTTASPAPTTTTTTNSSFKAASTTKITKKTFSPTADFQQPIPVFQWILVANITSNLLARPLNRSASVATTTKSTTPSTTTTTTPTPTTTTTTTTTALRSRTPSRRPRTTASVLPSLARKPKPTNRDLDSKEFQIQRFTTDANGELLKVWDAIVRAKPRTVVHTNQQIQTGRATEKKLPLFPINQAQSIGNVQLAPFHDLKPKHDRRENLSTRTTGTRTRTKTTTPSRSRTTTRRAATTTATPPATTTTTATTPKPATKPSAKRTLLNVIQLAPNGYLTNLTDVVQALSTDQANHILQELVKRANLAPFVQPLGPAPPPKPPEPSVTSPTSVDRGLPGQQPLAPSPPQTLPRQATGPVRPAPGQQARAPAPRPRPIANSGDSDRSGLTIQELLASIQKANNVKTRSILPPTTRPFPTPPTGVFVRSVTTTPAVLTSTQTPRITSSWFLVTPRHLHANNNHNNNNNNHNNNNNNNNISLRSGAKVGVYGQQPTGNTAPAANRYGPSPPVERAGYAPPSLLPSQLAVYGAPNPVPQTSAGTSISSGYATNQTSTSNNNAYSDTGVNNNNNNNVYAQTSPNNNNNVYPQTRPNNNNNKYPNNGVQSSYNNQSGAKRGRQNIFAPAIPPQVFTAAQRLVNTPVTIAEGLWRAQTVADAAIVTRGRAQQIATTSPSPMPDRFEWSNWTEWTKCTRNQRQIRRRRCENQDFLGANFNRCGRERAYNVRLCEPNNGSSRRTNRRGIRN